MFLAPKTRHFVKRNMGNKIKRGLRAFDDKDLSSLTTLVGHQCLDPNELIPDKGVSLFHLIIGHQSENFALKVTKLFLRCGGDPNIASEDGVTPVHVAAAWGRTRILHLLLVNGGDPWLQDDDRKNAFNYAFEEQEWDAVEMLHHFQQMHSSALCKRDLELNPKFELNFERILLRKGDEMFEYALANDKNKKSAKAQMENKTENERADSPVLSKIKYFESYPSNKAINRNVVEKSNLECSKECFETSCEFIVNAGENEFQDMKNISCRNEEESGKHFVSSIHIDTSPLKTEELTSQDSIILVDKSSSNSMRKSFGDVRSQLFMELQEAVLRRSKLRLDEHEDKKKEENDGLEVKENCVDDSIIELHSNSQPSIVCIPNERDEGNSFAEDPFVAKEVSYLYGVNLSKNSLLRHMSDFATKVMKEIELSEAENESEKTNLALTSTYLSCEDESNFKDNMGNPIAENTTRNSFLETSNDSFLSVAEEYKYTDPEEGVVLLEKKLLVTPTVSEILDAEECEMECDNSSIVSDVSSVPSAISYASDTLRSELTSFGFNPGPITKTTKKLYLRKLWRLKKANKRLSAVKKAYSPELEKTLKSELNFGKILSHVKLEEEMIMTFDEYPSRKWREGGSKTSFNYLLLDPRVSLNLPRRAVTMPDLEIWQCFLSSIFYVGKGKRARPYAHLYEAVSSWQKGDLATNSNAKIGHILDIWSEDLGVVCLHVFQNIIPVEAYTREAAMIDAIGLTNLKNMKSGEYYGAAATWVGKSKVKLGVYLLYKAMLIFLNEGERQIRPFDIS